MYILYIIIIYNKQPYYSWYLFDII